MIRALPACTALFALALPAAAQERPGNPGATFEFHDASVDAVLRYVSRVTGWVFVLEAPLRGTITAVSDAEIPASRCLEFLNACLRKHQLFVVNPAEPRTPRPGEVLRVIDLSKPDRPSGGVIVGIDPREIPSARSPGRRSSRSDPRTRRRRSRTSETSSGGSWETEARWRCPRPPTPSWRAGRRKGSAGSSRSST